MHEQGTSAQWKRQAETSDARCHPHGCKGIDPTGKDSIGRRCCRCRRCLAPHEMAHTVEARLDALVRTMYAELQATEPLMRAMIRLTVDRSRNERTTATAEAEPPKRGYRRIDWIELALAPVHTQLDESSFERLVSGLALCIGIEAFLVLRDIRGLDLAAAEEV